VHTQFVEWNGKDENKTTVDIDTFQGPVVQVVLVNERFCVRDDDLKLVENASCRDLTKLHVQLPSPRGLNLMVFNVFGRQLHLNVNLNFCSKLHFECS